MRPSRVRRTGVAWVAAAAGVVLGLGWLPVALTRSSAHVDQTAALLAAFDCTTRNSCLTRALATTSPSIAGLSHGAYVNHVAAAAAALDGDVSGFRWAGPLALVLSAVLVALTAGVWGGASGAAVAVAVFLSTGAVREYLSDPAFTLLWHFVPVFAAATVAAGASFVRTGRLPLLGLAAACAAVAFQFHLIAIVLLPGLLLLACLAERPASSLAVVIGTLVAVVLAGSPGMFVGVSIDVLAAAAGAVVARIPGLLPTLVVAAGAGLMAGIYYLKRIHFSARPLVMLAAFAAPGLVLLWPGVPERYAVVVEAPLAVLAGTVVGQALDRVFRQRLPPWEPVVAPLLVLVSVVGVHLASTSSAWTADRGGFEAQRAWLRDLPGLSDVPYRGVMQVLRGDARTVRSLAQAAAIDWPLEPVGGRPVPARAVSVVDVPGALVPEGWQHLGSRPGRTWVAFASPSLLSGSAVAVVWGGAAGARVTTQPLEPPDRGLSDVAAVHRGAPQTLWIDGPTWSPEVSNALEFRLKLNVPPGQPETVLALPPAANGLTLRIDSLSGVAFSRTDSPGVVRVRGDGVERSGELVVSAVSGRQGVDAARLLGLLVPLPMELPVPAYDALVSAGAVAAAGALGWQAAVEVPSERWPAVVEHPAELVRGGPFVWAALMAAFAGVLLLASLGAITVAAAGRAS